MPSKLSSTVRLLGDELGAEDVHLLVTRVLQFLHEHCRAAAVLDTTVFTHFQNLFLRIFTFLNRNFNKLSTTEIATLVWRQQTSSPMLGEVETGRLKCLVSGYQKSLIDPMQCTGVMKLSF